MKRVAIPLINNKLSEYFGECHAYNIYDIEDDKIQMKTIEITLETDILNLPNWLKTQGVTDIIVYKISRKIISLFAANKMNLFVGVKVNSPEKLIDDYRQGKLKSDEKIISEITNN